MDQLPLLSIIEAFGAYTKRQYQQNLKSVEFRLELECGSIASVRLEIGKPVDPKPPPLMNEHWFQHGPDFRSITWFNEPYSFTAMQAAVISCLWRSRQNGVKDVSQSYLLEEAGSRSHRLCDLFRRSPAWQRVIASVGMPGTYRIVDQSPKDANCHAPTICRFA